MGIPDTLKRLNPKLNLPRPVPRYTQKNIWRCLPGREWPPQWGLRTPLPPANGSTALTKHKYDWWRNRNRSLACVQPAAKATTDSILEVWWKQNVLRDPQRKEGPPPTRFTRSHHHNFAQKKKQNKTVQNRSVIMKQRIKNGRPEN